MRDEGTHFGGLSLGKRQRWSRGQYRSLEDIRDRGAEEISFRMARYVGVKQLRVGGGGKSGLWEEDLTSGETLYL